MNPRKKIGAILEEPLVINTKLSKAERKEKALAIMAKVGLKAEHYERYPHMFSGGQRQRIAIARGLMLDLKCHRGRRTRVCLGRVRSGTSIELDDGFAARVWLELCVYLPRFVGGGAHC